MKKSLYGFLAILATTGTLVTGWGATAIASSAQQQVSMDILTEPPTLDPSKANDTTSGWVMNQILEGLTYLGPKNQIEPGIAASWAITDGGKVYTFHLRNAKWTNGSPVTAQDFVYSILHTLNPRTGAQFASFLYYIKGAQAYNTDKGTASGVGVKAVNAHTLQFALTNPTPFFMELTTFWPYFPVDSKVAQADPTWTANANTYVGDGPFKLTTWNHQQDIVLTKNPNYWNASAIKLNKVTLDMVNDIETQYQMYESGQLSMDTSLPLDIIPNLIKGGKAHVFPFAGTQFIDVNVKRAPFNNVDIRQAFALSINRQQIVNDVLQGGQSPAYGMVPPGIPGKKGSFRQEGGNLFKENVAKAKQLLKEGLKQEGLTKLPPITFIYDSGTAQQNLAEVLQQMWAKNLGVQVNLQTEEWKVYLSTLSKRNYQIARLGWINVYMDPTAALQLLTSNFGANFTGWSNSQYDKLVNESTTTTDVPKRMAELHQAEQILMRQMPIIPINFYTNVFAFNPNLGGIVVHVNSEFPDLRYMYVK
ncbi:MAG: peptide ABC transporter substrate-binding protein [Bacilli bacterium]